MMPSTNMVINKPAPKKVKIVDSDKLIGKRKELMRLAHEIAHQSGVHTWNSAVKHIDKISPLITGDDALAVLTTLLCHFSALWIHQMMGIVEADETGRTSDEIFEYFIQGTKQMLGRNK